MPLNNGLPVVTKDALAGGHGEYEIVLPNPQFGKKSNVTLVNEAGGGPDRACDDPLLRADGPAGRQPECMKIESKNAYEPRCGVRV